MGSLFQHGENVSLCDLGIKTRWKRTELSGATFIFIFLCESRNEYENFGNKYENR
jgi:hypothetical protein